MTFSRQVFALLALAGFSAIASAATPAASYAYSPAADAPSVSAYYSFADVYRLTVGEAMQYAPATDKVQPQAQPAVVRTEQQTRVSSRPDSTPAGYEFSIAAIPQPSGWLLLLSGLALAGWVARRRMGYSF